MLAARTWNKCACAWSYSTMVGIIVELPAIVELGVNNKILKHARICQLAVTISHIQSHTIRVAMSVKVNSCAGRLSRSVMLWLWLWSSNFGMLIWFIGIGLLAILPALRYATSATHDGKEKISAIYSSRLCITRRAWERDYVFTSVYLKMSV